MFLISVGIFKPAPAAYYHAPKGEWKGASMNDLPIPEGDWQEDYNRRNLPYNIFLASGVIAFVVSLVVVGPLVLFVVEKFIEHFLL